MAEPSKRGFSVMDKAKQKEIASKGGKAAHQKGTAHEFTSDEAREAGRKGGAKSRERRLQRAREGQGAGGNEEHGVRSAETGGTGNVESGMGGGAGGGRQGR